MRSRIINTLAVLLPLLIIHACGKPAARFQVENEGASLTVPATVGFRADMTEIDSVSWDFGDGEMSRDPEVDHTFWMSGRYRVVLTVWKGRKHAKHAHEIIIGPPEHCLVRISTPMGDMAAELSDLTPVHRDNFVKLVESGFYDSLIFHRVISGFMIQGGDPNSRNAGAGARLGTGGPGYQLPAEFSDSLVHIKGALAAARMGDQVNPEKRSSGSQFYIVQGNPVSADALAGYERQKGFTYSEKQKKLYSEMGGTPFLDGEYTVFGRVILGLDVIDRIAQQATDRANRPLEDVPMKMQIIR